MGKRIAAGLIGWGCVVASALQGGCGTQREDEAAPLSQAEFVAEVAAIRCEKMSSCCQGSGFAFDVAACRRKAATNFQTIVAEFDANADYDPAAARECLAALGANSSCGRFDERSADAFDRAFPGTLEPGQPCNAYQECRREPGAVATCATEDESTPRVCHVLAPARAAGSGERCSWTCNEQLPFCYAGPEGLCFRAQGLYCSKSVEPPTCAPLIPIGQACPSDPNTCEIGAFCDYTDVCTALRANGQPCFKGFECQSGHCGGDVCVEEEPVEEDECRREYN